MGRLASRRWRTRCAGGPHLREEGEQPGERLLLLEVVEERLQPDEACGGSAPAEGREATVQRAAPVIGAVEEPLQPVCG